MPHDDSITGAAEASTVVLDAKTGSESPATDVTVKVAMSPNVNDLEVIVHPPGCATSSTLTVNGATTALRVKCNDESDPDQRNGFTRSGYKPRQK